MIMWCGLWLHKVRRRIERIIALPDKNSVLQEILLKGRGLPVCEERAGTPDYDERVIDKDDVSRWSSVLTAVLGAPVKPAGVIPTEEHLSVTENYGGIQKSQTLYWKEFEDVCVAAMFWPWGDGKHVTLKMACARKSIDFP